MGIIRLVSFRTFLCFVSLSLAIISTAQAAEKTLKLALEHWPPYIDKSLPEYGMAAELVITALDRAGYKTNITFANWSLSLQGTGIGVYDVIATAWYSKQREALFEFSEPYLYNKIKFIKHRKSSIEYRNLDDLRGQIIGVVANYAYSPEFDRSDLFYKIPSNHLIQNLSLLQLGKIDLTLDDELVIKHQIETYMPSSADQFVILDKPLDYRALHMMVSRSNPEHKQIVSDFNKAIKQMREDGTMERIIKKYGIK